MDDELLANLYVQLGQLHRSLRFEDVVRAIEEALINLVGTEDFSLFLRDHRGRFEPLLSHGHGSMLTGFAEGEGSLGRVARSGRPSFGEAIPAVALASGRGGPCMGVVAVARLLPHRGKIGAREQTLLEALGSHAGVALEAALCAENSGIPRCDVPALRARLAAQTHVGAVT